ncbi:MAG: Zn-ribbon domain-containing OB-fold protein, partial [Metallosphaera sp.]
TKCDKCGKIYFPPQRDCSECMNSNLKYVELSNEGELLTYTIINVKPSSFSHYPDYIVGVVRLKEGVNILGWVNVNPKEIKVGMKLKIIITRREPEGYYIYEFIRKE